MDVRRNHLKPTMFVDAVPELAAARTPRDDPEAVRAAEDQSGGDAGESDMPDVAAQIRGGGVLSWLAAQPC